MVCNYTYHITRDIAESEDVVQEAFIEIWNKYKIFENEIHFRNTLFLMSKNRAIDRVKSRESRQVRQLSYINNLQDAHQPIEEEADRYELLEKVFVLVRQLPPKCKLIFELAKIKGLSYNEIADSLDISVKTVENQMNKAFMLIRLHFKERKH